MILGIDVGSCTGFYFADDVIGNGSFLLKNKKIYFYNLKKKKTFDLTILDKFVCQLVESIKPTAIVCGIPTAYHNTIVAHSEQIGVIKLIAQKKGIDFHEVIDSTCKKAVIGRGNAVKEDVMKWAKINNEHAADAKMFVHYIEQNNKK